MIGVVLGLHRLFLENKIERISNDNMRLVEKNRLIML